MTPSDQRAARDERALIWTVKSLSNEEELEPFVEAIPDILWGPSWRREAYSDHFRALVCNPDVHLYERIQGLLDSSYTGLLSSEAIKHREIACYKAMWALATLFETHTLKFPPTPQVFYIEELDVRHCASSALVLMQWNTFWPVRSRLIELRQYLTRCAEHTGGHEPDLTPVISYLCSLCNHGWIYKDIIDDDATMEAYLDEPQGTPALLLVPKFWMIIVKISTVIPHRLIFDYLSDAAALNSLPYRWIETLRLMRPLPYHFSHVKESLERSLSIVVVTQLHKFNATHMEWIDKITQRLCSFWRPDDPTVPIPPAHITRLARSIRESFATSGCEDLATAVIIKSIFDLYAGVEWPTNDPRIPWLENAAAREIIKNTFKTYADELSASANSTPILTRLRAIIAGLDSLHPAQIEPADSVIVEETD
ncbi:hypothetical protein C8R44DRAFT_886565 [Mycena epipterygia]|nr:hypothetical protein C8R44DRAFT_886565 [Mycena epipterygia]